MKMPTHEAVTHKHGLAGGNSKTPRQHQRLFQAVIKVALEKGYAHVTLDAVARQARISKGGLLYHFKSKAELIRATLCHYDEEGWLARAIEHRPATQQADSVDPLAVVMLVAAAEVPSVLFESNAIDLGKVSSGSDAASAYKLLACRLGMSGSIQGSG